MQCQFDECEDIFCLHLSLLLLAWNMIQVLMRGKWVWAGATLWPGGSEIHAKSDKSEREECATLITIGPYSTAPELPVYTLLIVWGNKNRIFSFLLLAAKHDPTNTLTQMIKSTCQYIYIHRNTSLCIISDFLYVVIIHRRTFTLDLTSTLGFRFISY